MKVKFLSKEFKDMASKVTPFSASKILASSGVVGMTIRDGSATIRAFNGTWAWGDVSCEVDGFTEEVFLAIRDNAMKIMQLHCIGDDFSIDVSDDGVVVGSTTIKLLQDEWDEHSLSPKVNLNDAHWLLVPGQVSSIVSTSINDSNNWSKFSVLYMEPDIIYAIGNPVPRSIAEIDFGLDSRLAIPYAIATYMSRMLAGGNEVSLAVLDEIIIVECNGFHIASTQAEMAFDSLPGKDIMLDGRNISNDGIVGVNIGLQLDIAALRDCSFIYLWTNENHPGLHFHSPGDETGSSSGTVWSSLENFRFVGGISYLQKLIPTTQMWRICTIAFRNKDDEFTEDYPTLVVSTEDGVRHYLSEVSTGPGIFDKIIEDHEYEELVDESE